MQSVVRLEGKSTVRQGPIALRDFRAVYAFPRSSSTTSSRIAANGFLDFIGRHQLGPLVVDHLALVVGNIVVFQEILANVEVVRFHFPLRTLDLS